jgi:hypothetical protein
MGGRRSKSIPGRGVGGVGIVASVDDQRTTIEELIGPDVVVRVPTVAVLPHIAASHDCPQAIPLKNVNPSVREALGKTCAIDRRFREPGPGFYAQGPRHLGTRRMIEIAVRTEDRRPEVK